MPGHKRNAKFGIVGSEIDITETDGFDNLHDAKGVLLDIENRLTAHYKAEKSFMLVNGSTVGILSAIFALCDEGDKIIIARNCHKSVYNACLLRKLKVIYIEPEFDEKNGFYKGIKQSAVDEAVNNNPDAKALVITSPTYEGYVSEITSDIPLIIDAAHGAHFGLADFPDYPKGDIVVSSLHKTLPALTQTAVINVYNKNLIKAVKLYLDIFETSSPSYILMSSVEKCLDYIDNNSGDFESCNNLLKDFHSIAKYNNLEILKTDDISRIIVSCAGANISGSELANTLRYRFNIEVEAASKNYATLISTVADDELAFKKLYNALLIIDAKLEKTSSKSFGKPPCPNGIQIISIDKKCIETELKKAAGKTANEFVFAYPPDIPLIVPGEVISEETINYLLQLYDSGVNIVSEGGLFPDRILTKAYD
jgi:arginine/lysine/ornithine decarboxylase